MKVLSYLVPLLAFIYSYPRVLVGLLGKENPWTSYLYLYGFGAIFFGAGILLILKTKSCQFGRGRDTLWFKVLIGGFVAFASVHAIWILLALYVPYKGGL